MHPKTNFRRQARMMRRTRLLFLFSIISAAVVATLGCDRKQEPQAPAGPTEVGVVTLAEQPVSLTRELPGRTSAVRVAEVRARVSGIVLRRLFEEGSKVEEGQALYEIDPAPYQAAVDSARAALARAEANGAVAKLQADRNEQLLKANAVSQQEYDVALAGYRAAEADIHAAAAALKTAEINLGFTQVNSPIRGRIGRSEVTEGAYVQLAQATLLATVQQIDQLYVDVTQSANEIMKLQSDFASGRLKTNADGKARVTLLLEDGTEYEQPGELQFSDVTVNPSTGSILLRAIFPNTEGRLFPGMFVRARLEEGVAPNALLVPQQGVARNQRGQPTALVVSADGKAEQRVLTLDRAVGNQWLVLTGLKPGEQLIVQNLQRVRPGMPVKPIPATNVSTEEKPAVAAR